VRRDAIAQNIVARCAERYFTTNGNTRAARGRSASKKSLPARQWSLGIRCALAFDRRMRLFSNL